MRDEGGGESHREGLAHDLFKNLGVSLKKQEICILSFIWSKVSCASKKCMQGAPNSFEMGGGAQNLVHGGSVAL